MNEMKLILLFLTLYVHVQAGFYSESITFNHTSTYLTYNFQAQVVVVVVVTIVVTVVLQRMLGERNMF